MERPHATESSLPGRILARLLLILLGFLIGIALFTPWDKIWASALAELDEKLLTIGLRWEGIDKDGPFGFRVRNLRISFADTPGSLIFNRAYVSMGFSPLAQVRLDTDGSQCELKIYDTGMFEFEGNLNLTALLGGADFKGNLYVAGNLFMPAAAKLPQKGWIDLRSQQLLLPDDRVVEDVAFTAGINGPDMKIHDFSMGKPLTLKTSGQGTLDPNNLYQTRFTLKGERTIGKGVIPYATQGTLADVIW